MVSKRTKRNTQEHHSRVIGGRTETIAGITSKARAHLHKASNCVREASNSKGSLLENHCELKKCNLYLCGVKQSYAGATVRKLNQYCSGPILVSH